MISIGFDASRSFTDIKTGTENYSFHLLKNLVKLNKSITLYIYIRPPTQISEISQIEKWPNNFFFKRLNYPFLWTQLGLAIQTILDRNIDLLFIPSHTFPLLRRPGLKTVITVHDLGAEYLPTKHQLKQRLYLKFITYYQLKKATHIIAVSNYTKKDIINKIGIDPNKITVIHEAYDKNLFKPVHINKQQLILDKYNLVSKNFFLFVGTVQPRKNLFRLIQAYSKFVVNINKEQMTTSLPPLVIVGNKGWLSDEIYSIPERLGIKDYVKFLGYIPNDHLPILYSGSIAFIFPSLFEGFGIPLLEAMACGTPVITSNLSSMPEVVEQAAILIDPYSLDSIYNAIYKIYTNKKLQIDLSQKGKKQVKKFSWEDNAKQTLQLLTNLC